VLHILDEITNNSYPQSCLLAYSVCTLVLHIGDAFCGKIRSGLKSPRSGGPQGQILEGS
jgi:hypothetical protein